MSEYSTCYIEVHLFYDKKEKEKKEKEKIYTLIGYEIEDNDKNILISPFLFKESIQDWSSDNNYVRCYELNTIKKNYNLLKKDIKDLEKNHSDICFKIDNIIKYIKNNLDLYAGTRIIY